MWVQQNSTGTAVELFINPTNASQRWTALDLFGSGPKVIYGFGSPVGILPAPAGSICFRLDASSIYYQAGVDNDVNGWSTSVPNYMDGIVPTGTVDGSNLVFTLPNSPAPSASLALLANGVMQKQGSDYTLSGVTITFSTPPASGTVLQAWGRF